MKKPMIFEKNRASFEDFIKNNKKPIKDPNYIQNWMTFKYINFVFKLPDNYLKDTLKIEDSKYPNLPILKYAKDAKIDTNIAVDNVKSAVDNFMKSNPPK